MAKVKIVSPPKSLQYYLRELLKTLAGDNNPPMSQYKFAELIGVHRSTIKRLFDGDLLLSYEIALKIEKCMREASGVKVRKAETWISYQTKYQLYVLRNQQQID